MDTPRHGIQKTLRQGVWINYITSRWKVPSSVGQNMAVSDSIDSRDYAAAFKLCGYPVAVPEKVNYALCYGL